MPYKLGSTVFLTKRIERTDDKEEYIQCYGIIVDIFNAWLPERGDRWRIVVKDVKDRLIPFWEDKDEGSIVVVDKD